MCPAMSFLAAIFYYPYYNGFNILTLLANWLKLVCFNFPFAYFTQLFFIQPLVRVLFKVIFSRQIKERSKLDSGAKSDNVGASLKPGDETEAIENVLKRIDEIKAEFIEEQKKKM
jgi:hypothetical protein